MGGELIDFRMERFRRWKEVESGDSDIVDGVISGQPDAFARLYVRHAPLVFRVCGRRLGSAHEGEDAMSATFLQAWQIHPRAVLVEGSLRSWLLAVAVNVARTQARGDRPRVAAWQRSAAGMLPAVPGPEAQVVQQVGATRDAAIVLEGIARLPERDRVVSETLGTLALASTGC